MRLVGYGLVRGLPRWLLAATLLIGLCTSPQPSSSAARLLSLGGRLDPAGEHRAGLFGLLALLGLLLFTWRLAGLGADLAGRDRAWIATRPVGRSRVAAGALTGALLAAALFAALLAVAAELRLERSPIEQVVGTLPGSSTLRLAASPEDARQLTWELGLPADEPLRSRARLSLLVRPLAGEGRSATLDIEAGGRVESYRVGAPRRLLFELPSGTPRLTLTHGLDGPPLALFEADAWLTRPQGSSRLASMVLALRLWLLMAAAGGLAMGLATRMAAGLAVLASLSLVLVTTQSALADGLGAGAYFSALFQTQAGWMAPWPRASSALWALGLAAAGAGLAARSIGPVRP